MEHPKNQEQGRDARIQTALLALFFCLLTWTAGVLGGSVAAFYVYSVTRDDPTRDWPAVLTFVVVTLAFGAFGVLRSLKMYRSRVAESTDA
ncbi:MAG: hypothetical protein QNJ07_02050 [Woeseiaceae bacterium]|nr:hypothetical protein [Woeseiaceae bacterium]